MTATSTFLSPPSRILIAAADQADIERYKGYLAGLECVIQTAIDGAATLDCVRHLHPHLVLLDPTFADVNGLEVCERIKNDPSTRRTIILMIIALNELGDIERAVEAGTDDYVSKPVHKAEMLKRMENMLRLLNRLD